MDFLILQMTKKNELFWICQRLVFSNRILVFEIFIFFQVHPQENAINISGLQIAKKNLVQCCKEIDGQSFLWSFS